MTNFGAVALVALAVFLLPLLVGCGNGQDAGLSRAEVEEIVDERIRTASPNRSLISHPPT